MDMRPLRMLVKPAQNSQEPYTLQQMTYVTLVPNWLISDSTLLQGVVFSVWLSALAFSSISRALSQQYSCLSQSFYTILHSVNDIILRLSCKALMASTNVHIRIAWSTTRHLMPWKTCCQTPNWDKIERDSTRLICNVPLLMRWQFCSLVALVLRSMHADYDEFQDPSTGIYTSEGVGLCVVSTCRTHTQASVQQCTAIMEYDCCQLCKSVVFLPSSKFEQAETLWLLLLFLFMSLVSLALSNPPQLLAIIKVRDWTMPRHGVSIISTDLK